MKRMMILALAALLLVSLAGCGGGKSGGSSTPPTSGSAPAKQPEATATPAPAPTVQAISIRIGSTEKAALKNLPMFLTNITKQEGVNVEYVEYPGGSEVSKALLNGEVDLAFTVVDNVFKDKSGEFRLLAMVTNGPGQALLIDSTQKDSIKTLKDLVGKAVGVSSLGSGPHKTLTALLQANNIDPKSVQVMPVGLDPREALGTGKVVGMVTIEPFITLGEQSGKGIIMVDARKPEGIKAIYGTEEVPWIALIGTSSYIGKNPDAVQRMVNVVSKSLRFIASSSATDISAQTPAFFKDEVKGDEKVFTSMLDANKATFSADGGFNNAALSAVWQRLQQAGAVSKDQAFSLDPFADTTFLKKALGK